LIKRILSDKIQKLILEHQNDDPRSLRLKWSKSSELPFQEIVNQIESRKKAQAKVPTLIRKGIIYPPPLSLEQCSSEYLAQFKSDLFLGKKCVDLTGGFGVDTYYFSKVFSETIYVESDPWLCEIAENNFKLWKTDVPITNSTAEKFIAESSEHFDLIYLDPARRTEGKKVFHFQDTQPNVLPLIGLMLQKATQIVIKASPLIDLQKAIKELKFVQKVWIVALKNEVKEVLFLVEDQLNADPHIVAVNLYEKTPFQFKRKEEDNAEPTFGVPEVGNYVYDPNRALIKSGAFNLVGRRFNLTKLGTNTHLYFSSEKVAFPGRVFKIESIISGNRKKSLVGRNLDIISKNYPLEAGEIQQKYKIKPGDGKKFLIAAGRKGASLLMHCIKIKTK